MIAQLQVRRGTTAEWAAASPVVLAAGEPGYDTTLKMLKFGDGTTEWASLESETLKKYPVGAIYQSTVSTSPATLFGGTWSALEGRMLIGADGTYTAGSTGGAATHTLATSEIPAHAHVEQMYFDNLGDIRPLGAPPTSSGTPKTMAADSTGNTPTSVSTQNTGEGGAHNNMPPYLAVYMWKRTA